MFRVQHVAVYQGQDKYYEELDFEEHIHVDCDEVEMVEVWELSLGYDYIQYFP